MRQSVKWEEWPYRTCAFIVVAFRLWSAVGGSLQGMSTATIGRRKQCKWLCAACGGQCDWRAPNSAFVIQDTEDFREGEKFFEHTLHRKVCVITRSSP